MSVPAYYDENGFTAKSCGLTLLKGIYDDRRPRKPVFIVKNDVLTKQLGSNRGMLITYITTTTTV
jgi:hypothetical protein